MEREGEPNHEGLVLFKKPRDRDRESVFQLKGQVQVYVSWGKTVEKYINGKLDGL